MSRLHSRGLRPHLPWLTLRRRLVLRSTLTRIALLRSDMLHSRVVLSHELLLLLGLLLSLLLSLRMLLLSLLHLILSKLRADVRRQVYLKPLGVSLHSSHLLRGHSLVPAMRESHHPILLLLLHHLLVLLVLLAHHCLALLLGLHCKRGVLRNCVVRV